MVVDENDSASYWMGGNYSHYWLPTNYFDGGYSVLVGSSSESTFGSRIEAAGARTVTPLSLKVSVEWLGNATLGISVALWQGNECTDSDGDGYGDPGYPDDDCPLDNCPEVYNLQQDDLDLDGIGDVCDPDVDGDDLLPEEDNCPFVYNPLQEDSDADSVGDACDNCPDDYNMYQYDEDGDGIGDQCDENILYVQCCLDMPPAYNGVDFSYQFWAINGEPPYTWSKGLGQIPYGLGLTGGGLLSGTPGWVGLSTFQLIVRDAVNDADTQWITIDVTDPPPPPWICGDADNNEAVDIDDVVLVVAYIFSGGPPPDPYEAGDVDCSGAVDIDDAVFLVMYIFSGGYLPCDINGDETLDCGPEL